MKDERLHYSQPEGLATILIKQMYFYCSMRLATIKHQCSDTIEDKADINNDRRPTLVVMRGRYHYRRGADTFSH